MSNINDFGRTSLVTHTTGLKERLEKCTMNEHLFKLKKDGKTVGYLKYDKYRPTYNNDLDVFGKYIDEDDDKWLEGVTSDFDEMLPFVTKDKNGKDVFAGDKIKAVISDVSSDSLVGTIVQNENPLACWMFKYRFDEERFGEKEHLAPAPDLQNIELIEDKDNE